MAPHRGPRLSQKNPRRKPSVCSTCDVSKYSSSASSMSLLSSKMSKASAVSSKASSGPQDEQEKREYHRVKAGLRKAIPAAIVMWAFLKMPSRNGLTSRRVINFLKRHYRVVDNPRKTGKSIGAMLRCAVEFGLLQKRGNRYILVKKNNNKAR